MIIIYHKKNKVVQILKNGEQLSFLPDTIAAVLVSLAQSFPREWLIWCHSDEKINLNLSKFENIFHHKKIMASYNTASHNYIADAIGYVEESPFIKGNKKVKYPSWLMSTDVGGIHASVLNAIGTKIKAETNFDYFINSVAKLGMLKGLLCYSEPELLIDNAGKIKSFKSNNYLLFRFVRQHYKKRWLLLLFLNLMYFEKQFPIAALCYSLFFKNRKKIKLNLDVIPVQSTSENTRLRDNLVKQKTINKDVSSVRLSLSKSGKTIDVIIPTIGRKSYLYDVLQDLARQTHLPQKVIIVEQNPQVGSVSELDYVTAESWPFIIKHIFTHQPGACNARNLALAEVESEWVFLNDDDNRLDENLIEKVFEKVRQYGAEVITTSYLQPNEIQEYKTTHQSGIFGSGNSFVKADCLTNVRFDKALEFGYGEDTDFGCQLRNQGHDIIYFPDLKITHLKAPMGGFRIPVKKQWEDEAIQPKPSPTVMLYKLNHLTPQQLKGYKTILFLKYYKVQKIKNPIRYFLTFKKQWKKSIYWANQLKLKHHGQ